VLLSQKDKRARRIVVADAVLQSVAEQRAGREVGKGVLSKMPKAIKERGDCGMQHLRIIG
jgi:hypothetical protein